MKIFKAYVKDKKTGKATTIISEYERKADFINDLRKNGYAVNPNMVKPEEVYNYIVNNTNCNAWDWKEINTIPAQ